MNKIFETFGRILRDPDPNGAGGGGAGAGDGGAGAGGGAATAWIDSLPAEIKTSIPEEFAKDPNVTKYKDVGEFVKGHINLSKLVGAKGVIIPKDDAPPEEMEKFYNALGRPEKAEGYKLSDVKDLHKGITVTPESKGWYQGIAHKYGLTNAQADGINQAYLSALSQAISNDEKSQGEAIKQAETALRQEWGDKFDANKALATKAVLKIGGQEVVDAFGDLGQNPVVLKFLAKVGGLISEDTLERMGSSNQGGDKEQAKQKIAEMESNKDHPLWKQDDPKHAEAVAERKKLYEILYAGSE